MLQLPLLCRTAGDIVEVFLIKHSLVSTHYARFSFASDAFKPELELASNSEEETAAKSTDREQKHVIFLNFSIFPDIFCLVLGDI